MIPDAIKTRLGAAPFKPFVLRLTNGDRFAVRHPELVSLSPGGRRVILWVDEERYVDIDVPLIESVGQASGNGDRRRSA